MEVLGRCGRRRKKFKEEALISLSGEMSMEEAMDL